jgi:hypothetical protein
MPVPGARGTSGWNRPEHRPSDSVRTNVERRASGCRSPDRPEPHTAGGHLDLDLPQRVEEVRGSLLGLRRHLAHLLPPPSDLAEQLVQLPVEAGQASAPHSVARALSAQARVARSSGSVHESGTTSGSGPSTTWRSAGGWCRRARATAAASTMAPATPVLSPG